VIFRGTFDYNIDSKNRLTVPAKFRAALSGGVVVAKGVESCVAIWCSDEYDQYTQAALSGLNPMSPKARELKRFFAANAVDLELDASGRIMLPQFLTEYAGLDREVVVTGAGECLEVWGREAWNTYNSGLSDRITDITADLGSA